MPKKTKPAPERPRGRPPGREYTLRVNVPVTAEQAARYALAARELGVPVSVWLRAAADAACPPARKGGRR